MPGNSQTGYAYNPTRQAFLATTMRLANTHWTRLLGLLTTNPAKFTFGQGLWIIPCHGIHTCGMRFPIDVIYLDSKNVVVHLEENIKPWRLFSAVRMDSATVLELPVHTIWNSGTQVGDQLEMVVKPSGNGVAA